MPQSPLLSIAAQPSIPITGGSIGSDPGTTGIPGSPTDVEAALAALQTQINVLPSLLHFLTSRGGGQAEVQTIAASGASLTLDLSLYNVFDITLTHDCTYTFTNPPPTGRDGDFWFVRRQGGAGSYTETWPGAVDWPDTATGLGGGSAPTLYTAVGAQNVARIQTGDGGTTYGGTDETPGAYGGPTLTPASTVTDETTLGITPAVGTGTDYARNDHTHGSPSAATILVNTGGHAHVASETHLSDGSTGLYTLDEAFEDGSVIGWNVTTIARLSVTETAPDQATVSPVGSAGDSIVFDYAAVLS